MIDEEGTVIKRILRMKINLAFLPTAFRAKVVLIGKYPPSSVRILASIIRINESVRKENPIPMTMVLDGTHSQVIVYGLGKIVTRWMKS